MEPRIILVHMLVMSFGTAAWIGVNSIFIQLPLLVNILPEKWGLAAYLSLVVQVANIAPIIYSLVLNSSIKISETSCIYCMLAIGSLVMGLLSFFYDKTSNIAGREYSTALFLLTFYISLVSCSSSVLFMPYLRKFKKLYLVSYFVGEGFGGVLPSIVALVQGINDDFHCNNSTNFSDKSIVSLRFSSKYYFLFVTACFFVSFLAFFLLENLSYIKKEKIASQLKDNNFIDNNFQQGCYYEEFTIASNLRVENQSSQTYNEKTEVDKPSTDKYWSICGHHLMLKNLYLYILLSIICMLANGLLPGLQPYSCLSYGSMIYHLSATLSQVSNPTACFLALWYLPHNRKLINYFSIVIFVTSGYLIFLALSSPSPPFQRTEFGKSLVILSWILLVGLFSYVKLMIASIFQSKSAKTLHFIGGVMQTGSACGAILSFILINFSTLLNEYTQCSR